MIRNSMLLVFGILLSSCTLPSTLVYLEDTEERYIEIREVQGQGVGTSGARVAHRPSWVNSTIEGNLIYILEGLHGQNPRIVIESSNRRSYQVIYQIGDKGALHVVARELGCVVSQEDRNVYAFTIRVQPGGHRLKPAAEGQTVNPEQVFGSRDEGYPLEGATMDDLAKFLEIQYRYPVVNLTSLDGRWSIRLAHDTGFLRPQSKTPTKTIWPLDDTGLELRVEKVKIPVTVVKDKPQ